MTIPIRLLPTITYAIGDVHGRGDLLEALVLFCLRDAKARNCEPRFIFIGDIGDRGTDTCRAWEMVADTLCTIVGSVLLKGNHDDWFVRFAGTNHVTDEHIWQWFKRGGDKTVLSYGCSEFEEFREIIRLFHADHLRYAQEAKLSFTCGRFHFVHAGIDPSKGINEQSERDCMWIREPFMDHVGELSHVIVHGHTVVGDLPEVTENRISIDTGAYLSGRLTAMALDEHETIRFFQTDGSADRVVQVDPVRIDRGMGTVLAGDLIAA